MASVCAFMQIAHNDDQSWTPQIINLLRYCMITHYKMYIHFWEKESLAALQILKFCSCKPLLDMRYKCRCGFNVLLIHTRYRYHIVVNLLLFKCKDLLILMPNIFSKDIIKFSQ